MSFYREQVLPRVVDRALRGAELRAMRAEVAAGLRGTIVEIGFGSGLNVPVYPAEVAVVYAVDPAVVGRKLAARRVAASPAEVRYVGLDGQSLPLEDGSCDGALCTFTLCTVPDPARALAELRRVLKPAGTFHFLEHGLAPDEKVVRWQRRIDPVQSRLFDGCHLSRPHDRLVRDAGFTLESLEQRYVKGPKPFSYFYSAVARPS